MDKMRNQYKKPRTFLLNELLRIFGDNLISVVIFGSMARKNYGENSDLDLIVVVKEEKNENVSELRKNYLMNFGKSLDLQIFSKKDVINNFNNFSPLFSTLLLGKSILFDRGMFFENLFEEFVKKMINQDIKYCEGGKIWELKKIAKSLEVLQ